MYKIAVIGDRESVMGFASLGLSVFEVTEPPEGEELIRKLADNGYAVIYLTEALAASLPHVLEAYRSKPLPVLIQIPGVTGNTGEGMRGVHKCVEQAVGSDILGS